MGEQTAEELKAKVALGSILIEMLECEDDPRAPGAIERLREQQQELKEMIKPPPIVVGCKPVVLSASAKGSPAAMRLEPVQVVDIVSAGDENVVLTLQY